MHHLRYVEIRPKDAYGAIAPQFRPTSAYCLHQLDLRPDTDTLFNNLHKDSTQRKIKRARREGVACEVGRSDSLLATFCQLHLLTRRRHKVPPQPVQWFRNLIDCFGEALNIRVASKDGRPLAAILTIRHKETLVFKYGCSDTCFNTLGGMHLLLWNSIVDAKHAGLLTFDLGRSDCNNPGLLLFKDRWNAKTSILTYSRLTPIRSSVACLPFINEEGPLRIASRLASYLPDSVFTFAGERFYRHIG